MLFSPRLIFTIALHFSFPTLFCCTGAARCVPERSAKLAVDRAVFPARVNHHLAAFRSHRSVVPACVWVSMRVFFQMAAEKVYWCKWCNHNRVRYVALRGVEEGEHSICQPNRSAGQTIIN